MRRVALTPRVDLDERARDYGFTFHRPDGALYWDESVHYAFTLDEIERDLEAPTNDLAALCLDLAGRIVNDEALLRRLAIPEHAWALIARSWKAGEPSLYGRFDFAYNGSAPAKLLEYNADTPTALFEAAVFQWVWLEDLLREGRLPPGTDQFNSLHEKLIERLQAIQHSPLLHIAAMLDHAEDAAFVAYLDDCARQAGYETTRLDMRKIGQTTAGDAFGRRHFVDLDDRRIEQVFKLYPWEWMFADEFGHSPAMRRTRFIEPPWKAVLSNKGILPLLWEMAPGHPNLLPAFFEDDPRKAELGARFARKPLYSREGANVLIVDGDVVVAQAPGEYGDEGFVRQGLALLPDFDGYFPVVGSWVVGDTACGIGIREDDQPITRDTSRFVPHVIEA